MWGQAAGADAVGCAAPACVCNGRSSWRGKALLICSGVAMVALLCFVGLDRSSSKGFDRASLGEASNEGMNGGTSGKTAHNGDASDFIDTADLGDYVDAIIGPVPTLTPKSETSLNPRRCHHLPGTETLHPKLFCVGRLLPGSRTAATRSAARWPCQRSTPRVSITSTLRVSLATLLSASSRFAHIHTHRHT
jgi:hypothetical protein